MTTRTDGNSTGLLLVDKPEGPTSHDIVQRARRMFGTRRIGHTGTLDPFASGLLLLCLGRATRLVEFFHLLPKRYRAEVELGLETSTHDPTGDPVSRSGSWRQVDRDQLETALGALTGELAQIPPAFSAKKLGGTRAHTLARSGTEVELPPVPVVVHSIDVRGFAPPVAELDLWVSTGTYVRALARDLGRSLGCGAHLAGLRRTQIGPFEVSTADRLDGSDRLPSGTHPGLLTPGEALGWLPQRELSPAEIVDVTHGRSVQEGGVSAAGPADWPASGVDGWPVALMSGRDLVAVARRTGGRLRPVRVLHAA